MSKGDWEVYDDELTAEQIAEILAPLGAVELTEDGRTMKDKGKEFDDQHDESRRRAEKKGVPPMPSPGRTGGGRKPGRTDEGNPRGKGQR
jgi:hypothetical protein